MRYSAHTKKILIKRKLCHTAMESLNKDAASPKLYNLRTFNIMHETADVNAKPSCIITSNNNLNSPQKKVRQSR